MNRRGFLRGLATGAVVGVTAPAALAELLAPKRTIFLPPRGGWFSPAYDLQTAIGAELDALLRSHSPIYYNDAGLEMIEARVHAVIRKYGETDAELRARMMKQYTFTLQMPGMEPMTLEAWPADKAFEIG